MRERICDCAKRLFEREGYEQVIYAADCSGGRNCSGKFDILLFEKGRSAEGAFKRYSETFSESIQLFEIDLERGEISGKPFWEYENRTLLELLLRFLKLGCGTVSEECSYRVSAKL